MELKKRPLRKTSYPRRTKPLNYTRRTKKNESTRKDVLMVQLVASVLTLIFVFGASKTSFDTAEKFTESLKYALHQQPSMETMQQTVTDSVSTFKKIQLGILGFFGFTEDSKDDPDPPPPENDTTGEEEQVLVTPIGQENPLNNNNNQPDDDPDAENSGADESAKKPIPPLLEAIPQT